MKSKCLKWVVEKKKPDNIRHENAWSKIKPRKIEKKKPGTTYCLGCTDYTDNFKQQEVKMTNKVLGEKSNCVVCRSCKSTFLKQKHSNKK